jgi:hypothetical protein
MKKLEEMIKRPANRRSFLKNGIAAAGASVGAGLLGGGSSVFGREREDHGPDITRGDVAILQFLAAAELIESDLWQQYNELRGSRRGEFRVRGGPECSRWRHAAVHRGQYR